MPELGLFRYSLPAADDVATVIVDWVGLCRDWIDAV